MLHVFDLDDTLVHYGHKHKISVPRQTLHCLRALKLKGCNLSIISLNPLGHLVAAKVGLTPFFIDKKHVVCSNHMDRDELMNVLLQEKIQCDVPPLYTFHYWDDRKNNLEAIQLRYPTCILHHVLNPMLLFK